ncbi:MAG: hypothetical protein INR62_07800 [Rhodospirillales bacterium]|nr:hypothetical protein [Acetobacter sp.]
MRTFAAMLPHTGGMNPVIYGRIRPKKMLSGLINSNVGGAASSAQQPSGFMQIDQGSLRLVWTVLTDGTRSCVPFLVSGFDPDNGGAHKMMVFYDALRDYSASAGLELGNINQGEADDDLCSILSGSRMPTHREL